MTRWLVERANGEMEDCGWESLRIEDSGALVFRKTVWDAADYIIAPGQWKTVTRETEDET